MRRFIFTTLALTVFVACQPASTELTEEQKAVIAAEVNAIQADFWDAWTETDVDRGISFNRNSPEYTYASEGQLVVGFAQFEEIARSNNADVESMTMNIAASQTRVLAPNVVCVTAQGTGVATDTTGETGPEAAYAFTFIWVLRDGEWKIELTHFSAPTPEAPQEAEMP
jgi:hypothetical protein